MHQITRVLLTALSFQTLLIGILNIFNSSGYLIGSHTNILRLVWAGIKNSIREGSQMMRGLSLWPIC